jgi:hypothetical protein
MARSEPLGEVIATSSSMLAAQSHSLNRPPPLGSLVKVAGAQGHIYAIVCFGETGSIDTGRRPIARSGGDVEDEEVYRQNPQLEMVLRTEFQALLVGERRGGLLRRQLPLQPPPLHYSVHGCSPEEVREFTDRYDHFRLVLEARGLSLPAPEVLAAHMRFAYQERGEDRGWLERAGRQAAELLKYDYEGLMGVLLAAAPEREVEP